MKHSSSRFLLSLLYGASTSVSFTVLRLSHAGGDGEMARPVWCLPHRCEGLTSIPSIEEKAGLVMCTYNPSSGEMETEGPLGFSGHTA